MGCGKSSIGRLLHKKLDMPLIDLDEYLVEQSAMSIPAIFERYGEQAFRDMESAALGKLIARKAILATGGGVVLRKENRRLLKAHPPVIWLKSSPEFLAARISGDANRPLIANQDALQRLTALARTRNPLYEACADLVIPRDSMEKDDIATRIVDYLNGRYES